MVTELLPFKIGFFQENFYNISRNELKLGLQ